MSRTIGGKFEPWQLKRAYDEACRLSRLPEHQADAIDVLPIGQEGHSSGNTLHAVETLMIWRLAWGEHIGAFCVCPDL